MTCPFKTFVRSLPHVMAADLLATFTSTVDELPVWGGSQGVGDNDRKQFSERATSNEEEHLT